MAPATSEPFYDANAGSYDARHAGPWWAQVRRWEARAVRLLRPPILDIGCGTGYWQQRLRAVGIDASRGMLARNRGSSALAQAEALPFVNGAFRGASCMLTVLNTPAAGAALREIARVLEPGGRAAVSIASVHDAGGRRWKRFRANGAALRERLYSRGEFEQLAAAAGLRCIAFNGLFKQLRMRWEPFPMTAEERAQLTAERALPPERGQLYSFVFEKPRHRAPRA